MLIPQKVRALHKPVARQNHFIAWSAGNQRRVVPYSQRQKARGCLNPPGPSLLAQTRLRKCTPDPFENIILILLTAGPASSQVSLSSVQLSTVALSLLKACPSGQGTAFHTLFHEQANTGLTLAPADSSMPQRAKPSPPLGFAIIRVACGGS